MKKIVMLFLISLFAICPTISYAKTVCTEGQIETYRKELNDVSFNVEIEKSTNDENIYYDKVSIINKPKSFDILLFASDNVTYTILDDSYTLLPGGVYTLRFYHEACGTDLIKEYTMMFPYYKKDGQEDNVWFDGTYERHDDGDPTINPKKELDRRLLIILIALLIIIISFLIFRFVRRRKIK